jgi:hypothetical protein
VTRDLLADARACLAAASTAPPDLRVIYSAKARAAFVALCANVEELGRVLEAVEREIGRVAAK